MEAEPLYKKALEIAERSLGPNHPDVANILTNISELYRKIGKEEEAARLEKRVNGIIWQSQNYDVLTIIAVILFFMVLLVIFIKWALKRRHGKTYPQKCPSCNSKFTNKTVCPDCVKVLRPWQLTAVSVIYFLLALDVLISMGGSGVIKIGWSILIGIIILRMSRFAIGFSMITVPIGIIYYLLKVFAFQGGISIISDSYNSEQMMVWINISLIMCFIMLILLFSKSSRNAFGLLGQPGGYLKEVIDKEKRAPQT